MLINLSTSQRWSGGELFTIFDSFASIRVHLRLFLCCFVTMLVGFGSSGAAGAEGLGTTGRSARASFEGNACGGFPADRSRNNNDLAGRFFQADVVPRERRG